MNQATELNSQLIFILQFILEKKQAIIKETHKNLSKTHEYLSS